MGNRTDEILKAAHEYSEKYNYPIIPVNPENKKPFVAWLEFQKRKASPQEIEGWWKKRPNAMIGAVTGLISRDFVIDVDPGGDEALQEYVPDSLLTPTSITPRGGKHLHFEHPDKNLTIRAGILPHVDYRGQGGYICMPPSRNAEGKGYRWLVGLSLADVPRAPLPDALLLLFSNSLAFGGNGGYTNFVTDSVTMFVQGRRDSDLFHVCNHLVRSRMPVNEIEQVLERLALSCDPPFPSKEIPEKIKSALKRSERRETNVSEEIRRWVSVTNGDFSVTECFKSIQSVTPVTNRDTVRQILYRLWKDGEIKKSGNRDGVYRRIEVECEEIDFLNASDEVFKIQWPFGIERYVEISPKNVIIVAGEKDAGKTAFLLNTVRMNMHSHQIFYFSSEMGDRELRKRLLKFEPQFKTSLKEWSFVPLAQSSNFGDSIRPDDINIIDFLEVYDEFYKIGLYIKEIYDKLQKGIAIIAIQKNRNTDFGLGGMRSIEKARLYLAMEKGKIKIVSGKNWASEVRPDGLSLDFKLVQGCEFKIDRDWYRG